MCTFDVLFIVQVVYVGREKMCTVDGLHFNYFIIQVVYVGRETMCTFDVFYLLYRWYMLAEKPCVQ
jgi:hypothetical protein